MDDYRVLASGGALFMLAVVTSWWAHVPAVILCGFGFGLGSSVASIASPRVARPGRAGEVSGMMLTMRRTAGGISLAVAAGIVGAFERGEHGIAATCNLTPLIIACLSAAASLIAMVAGHALARRGLIKPEQHRFRS